MLFCISQFQGLLLTVSVLNPWWRLVALDLAFSMEGVAISWQLPSVPALPTKGNWASARARSCPSWRENSGRLSSSTSQSCWALPAPWSTNKLNLKTNYFSVRCLSLHCHMYTDRGICYRDTSYSYLKIFFQCAFSIKCDLLRCKKAQPAFPNCSCGNYLIQERDTGAGEWVTKTLIAFKYSNLHTEDQNTLQCSLEQISVSVFSEITKSLTGILRIICIALSTCICPCTAGKKSS